MVVEVKYKPDTGLPDRRDLNQAITYGFAYNANHVVIAQPRAFAGPAASGIRRLGTISGLEVWMYTFNLQATDFQEEEERWTAAIHELIKQMDV